MRRYAFAIVCTVACLSICSCQKLFTYSLASYLARPSVSVTGTLSTSQASDLAAQAKENNDSALAAAVVSSLVAQISSSTIDAATKTSLEASAASAAITASGASSSLTEVIGSVSSGDVSGLTGDTIQTLLTSIQSGASQDGVIEALSYLDTSASGLESSSTGLSATEYAIAAIVVAASVLPSNADELASFNVDTLSVEDKATLATASAIASVASTMLAADGSTQSQEYLDQLIAQFKL
jgi:hypothetical protein